MIDDQPLTEHFRLYELTQTSRLEFQEQNRDINELQISKLTQLARLLEHIRFVLGEPLIIHSGYRCPALNEAIGGAKTSQHVLCEAADFTVSQDLGNAFRLLWRDVKDKSTNVGQLIHETAQRSYGVTSWIHVSLGMPFRDESTCKQILRFSNGQYQLLA